MSQKTMGRMAQDMKREIIAIIGAMKDPRLGTALNTVTRLDATPDLGFMLMPGNVGNYAYYKSDAMKELFATLRKTTDPGTYQKVLYDIQRQFSQDVPFICLYYRSGSILTRDMLTIVNDVRELELRRGTENYQKQ